MLIIIIISAVCLLNVEARAPSTDKCGSVLADTCLQTCNSTSCNCASSDAYTECNQACERTTCRTLTCSSGTCYQQCHNCHMECTSDVDYCNQQCLSGACSFKCTAKRCVQECEGRECANLPSDHEKPFIPRLYLVILAGLFAATTVLTCLALVISCSQMGCCRRRRTKTRTAVLLKSRDLGSSIRSLPMKSDIV